MGWARVWAGHNCLGIGIAVEREDIHMETTAIKQKVWDVSDNLWLDEVNFLRELVRRPSTRGQTSVVQHFISGGLREMGLDVTDVGIDIGQIAQLPGFAPPEWSYEGLFNVIGTMAGSGIGGRSLLMNGHVDVVSIEPAGHWSYDPWGGDIVDGRMYGRGAADMKSGLAAMIYAVKALQVAGVALRGDVLVETVIDEECTGNGTLSCLAQGYHADGAVVPEPTDLTLVTASPGVLWCRLQVRGRGAHAQSASTAMNAAEKAMLLITALRELEAEWNQPQRHHSAFTSVEHPLNFNVGTFHAGDWPSTVPELCKVEMRLSYFPGERLNDVKQRVRQHIEVVASQDAWLSDNPPELSFFGHHAEPALYDVDHELSQLVAINHRTVSSQHIQEKPFTATIDNRFFQLYYGIPNVCYGPSGGQLHAPDEWVDMESIRICTRTLIGVLIDWCGVA